MYEKWKKANFLLNTSHLSDHFSWHSFRFPLSVAELSNVNDWQLSLLIGKQLTKNIFFWDFFSRRERNYVSGKYTFPKLVSTKENKDLENLPHHWIWSTIIFSEHPWNQPIWGYLMMDSISTIFSGFSLFSNCLKHVSQTFLMKLYIFSISRELLLRSTSP